MVGSVVSLSSGVQGDRTRLRRRSERSSWYVRVSNERGRYLSTSSAISSFGATERCVRKGRALMLELV